MVHMGAIARKVMVQDEDLRSGSLSESPIGQNIPEQSIETEDESIDLIRSAVGVTKEAARAISITALEAVSRRSPIHGRDRLSR